jgi:hypothetical protein
MGSKRKAWIQQPVTEEEFLFKYARRDGTGDARGDDWAEKLAAELAALLGIATPPVELATRRNERGVVCRRMADPDLTQLVHGNELLARIDPAYADSPLRDNPHYTVGAVRACLAGSTAELPGRADADAFDLWVGYLVLDAWIANTDRHHENWGVLVDQRTDGSRLAPSFDHGSSLGFNVSPALLPVLLDEPGRLERWCAKGRSAYFAGKPSLVDVASEALASAGSRTRELWLARLDAVRQDDWERLVARVTDERMSEPTRTFVTGMLSVNRRRVLDVRR